MKQNKIVGAILAGGNGGRMSPLSERHPKCILPVCNKPIIAYQIEMMVELGIAEIAIVVAHRAKDMIQAIGDGEQYGATIKYVDQNEPLGIAHALGKLEEHIDGPFLLFLGDIFFVTRSLDPMIQKIQQADVNAVLATKVEHDFQTIQRNFAVIADDRGNVQRVIEKPRRTCSQLKGCGIYMFDHHIFDAVRKTPRTAMRNEYELTDSIQLLIDDGCLVKYINTIDEDVNLTYPSDLLWLNLNELRRRKKEKIFGKGSIIKNLDLIRSSVIGDNVTIREGTMITNSVIFSHTVIKSKKPITNMIMTPEHRISCTF